jgi:hypothetical protein
MSRPASVYFVTCPCGRNLEWPDKQAAPTCQCGRGVVVECWPNVGLRTVQETNNPVKWRK